VLQTNNEIENSAKIVISGVGNQQSPQITAKRTTLNTRVFRKRKPADGSNFTCQEPTSKKEYYKNGEGKRNATYTQKIYNRQVEVPIKGQK
jgi:hypothetical protein